MADRRMLWKRVSMSRKVNNLSLKAALLWTWCQPHLDVEGYIEAEADYLKHTVVPRRDEIKEQDVPLLVQEIIDTGLWESYQFNGVLVVKEKEFEAMQKVRKGDEAPSRFADNLLEISTTTGEPQGNHRGTTGEPSVNVIKGSVVKGSVIKEKIYVEQAQRIFIYWQEIMEKPNAIFTEGRKKKIVARLREGYTEENCMLAISYCSKSRFHRGENEEGKEYVGIELIFRNGEKLEGFINMEPPKEPFADIPRVEDIPQWDASKWKPPQHD